MAHNPNKKIAEDRAGLVEKTSSGALRWTGKVNLLPHHLDAPLRWREPQRIFVGNQADLFHPSVPDDFIMEVFSVMALAERHTFQILTKRPDRMAKLLGDESGIFWACVEGGAQRREFERTGIDPSFSMAVHGPLKNVWLGVSVENQAAADERIPELLATPAAVRFLSVEPLLGSVDLRGWGDHAPLADVSGVPESWSEYRWDDWVPTELRRTIETFWSPAMGRGPRAWMRDHSAQAVPRTGARVRCAVGASGWAMVDKMATVGVTGRYVHCWNNIGRVITDDGQVLPASGGRGSGWMSRWLTPQGEYKGKLHWVIAGGESGPGARPMHPDWVRSIRDRCHAAGVPFFFKQWGQWEPLCGYYANDDTIRDRVLDRRGVEIVDQDGGTWNPKTDGQPPPGCWMMSPSGKKRAGRILDGRTWDEMPEVSHG
jgi:protein gp37